EHDHRRGRRAGDGAGRERERDAAVGGRLLGLARGQHGRDRQLRVAVVLGQLQRQLGDGAVRELLGDVERVAAPPGPDVDLDWSAGRRDRQPRGAGLQAGRELDAQPDPRLHSRGAPDRLVQPQRVRVDRRPDADRLARIHADRPRLVDQDHGRAEAVAIGVAADPADPGAIAAAADGHVDLLVAGRDPAGPDASLVTATAALDPAAGDPRLELEVEQLAGSWRGAAQLEADR